MEKPELAAVAGKMQWGCKRGLLGCGRAFKAGGVFKIKYILGISVPTCST